MPEPAVSPPVAGAPPGRIVALPGEPEGPALDSRTGTLAVAVRKPDGVALVDLGSGIERAQRVRQVERISTGGAPYGLAVDAARRRLYVTLTGANQLRSYRIDGPKLVGK